MKSLIKLNNNGSNALFPEFPSLFDDFFTRNIFNFPSNSVAERNTIPAVNVKETNNSFELEMAVPGMDKNDFKVELEQDSLIISAQKEQKNEEKSDDGRFTRKEFSYQSFKRVFHLPESSVNEQEISANYKDGILQISVPKKEVAKPKITRLIAIN